MSFNQEASYFIAKNLNLNNSDDVVQSQQAFDQKPATIAIGSGKGGVGKTLIALNLAYRLATHGKRVTLVDMDLGSPGLHSLFNLTPDKTLKEFIVTPDININQLVYFTPVKNLNIICGSPATLGLFDQSEFIVSRLLKNVRSLNSDVAIFDLGSGLNSHSIRLFINVDSSILVGTPEPPVIMENFNFLKYCIIQKLESLVADQPKRLSEVRRAYTEFNSKIGKTIKTIIQNLDFKKKKKFKNDTLKFYPKFILNMVQHDADYPYALAIDIALKEMFDIELQQLGSIPFSRQLRHSLKSNGFKKIIDSTEEPDGFYYNIANQLKLISGNRGENNSPAERLKVDKKIDFPDDRIICSSNCGIWNSCQSRQGGYPCRIKYIGFFNSN